MAQYLVYRFDVTALNEAQRNLLDMMVTTQAEASDYDVDPELNEGVENYDDVPVARVCPWCHAALDFTNGPGGECGGADEGQCSESGCIHDFALPGHNSNPHYGTDVESYVRDWCMEHGTEDAPVPYRNDGLTYYGQLAYLVREYYGLEQPRRSTSRRLP